MSLEVSPEGHRNRKKRLTRARVHHAAVDLVHADGLDGVTVEQIAERAEISTRTFFNYFPTKEAAVVGSDPDLAELLRAELGARPRDEHALDSLRAVFLGRLRTVDHDREFARRRAATLNAFPSLLNAAAGLGTDIERRLTATVAERLGVAPETDPYPALVVGASLAAFRATLITSRHSGAPSVEATFERCMELIAEGLRTG